MTCCYTSRFPSFNTITKNTMAFFYYYINIKLILISINTVKQSRYNCNIVESGIKHDKPNL